MLFGMVSNAVCKNEGLLEISGERDVSYIIETGNKNNAEILKTFNDHKAKDEDPIPQVKSLSFVKKRVLPNTTC